MTHSNDVEVKKCAECGRDLFGRADKKFCSDACRSAFNNRLKADDAIIRKVNRKLKRNYQILLQLNTDGKTRVSKERLTREGFDFEYCTSTLTTRDQKDYRFCYDQGYLILSQDYYLLVRRELN